MKIKDFIVTIILLPLLVFTISCSNSGSIDSKGANSNDYKDSTTDGTGDTTTPSTVDPESDILKPIVTISSPADNSTLSGTVNLSVDASDNVGVTKVELWIGNDSQGHNLIASLSNTPYAANWDSTKIANGSYVLTAIAYDAKYNTGIKIINVTVDNIGGGGGEENDILVNLSGVDQGDTVTGSIILSAAPTTVSGDPIERVDFIVGNETRGYQMLGSVETTPFQISWDTLETDAGTPRFPDDLYEVVAIAFTNTQANHAVVQVLVANSGNDTEKPTASIDFPTDGSNHKGSITLAATSTDNVGVSRVEFFIDNELKGTDTSSPYSYDVDTTSITDGSHTIKVISYDAAGNSQESSVINATFDNTAPTVSVTSPTNGATIGGSITISANPTDATSGIDKVEFFVDNVLKNTTENPGPYSFTWNSTSVANGTYPIKAIAYDKAGNVTESSSISVTVYNSASAPTVTLTSPTSNAYVKGNPVSIQANATNNTSFVIKIDSGTVASCGSAATCSYSWNTTAASNGSHSITVEASDGSTTATESINVTVDNEVPSVNITAPLNGSTVKNSVTITANASDTVTGVSKVEFWVNGTKKYTDYSAPYSYTWDTTTESNGTVPLKAIAFDAAGNQTTDDDTTVTVDNDLTPPHDVNITSPTTGSTVSGTEVTISATASDNKGVTKVEFYINGVLKATDTAPPYSYTWDTTTENNGTYALKIIAYDAAGNNTTDNDTTVTVDNDKTPPVVNITSPANGATVSGTTTITANATDDKAVSKVDFYINGVYKGTASSPPYNYNWPTSEYSNGSYALKAIAYDSSNNSATDNDTTVTVSNGFTCQDWTDTNQNHLVAARIEYGGLDGLNVYYITIGGEDNVGGLTATTTVKETASGFFEAGSCGGSGGSGAEFTSIAADDGYVKAASDGSGATVGTTYDPNVALGRGSDSKYSRALLSFDTSSIPDGAIITRAYLQVTYYTGSGDPWASSNRLLVDVKTGTFGNSTTETGDWAAAADASGIAEIASFSSGSKNSTDFSSSGISAINKTGITQIKLRFENFQTSLAYIFIKNGANAKLIIEYTE